MLKVRLNSRPIDVVGRFGGERQDHCDGVNVQHKLLMILSFIHSLCRVGISISNRCGELVGAARAMSNDVKVPQQPIECRIPLIVVSGFKSSDAEASRQLLSAAQPGTIKSVNSVLCF
jgi:hypothetical protein